MNNMTNSEFYSEILLVKLANGEDVEEWEIDKLTQYIEEDEMEE